MMVSTLSEYKIRKNKIHQYLGGCCTECQSCDNLHVDHIDHRNKEFNVMENWGISWDRLLVELKKCQLLCKKCHLVKSKEEKSLAKGWTNESRQEHGTVWSYNKYKCRCKECKLAKSNAMKKEYERRKVA